MRHDFEQIASVRVKTLSNRDLVASRYLKREKGSLPVDVHRSKNGAVKLPNYYFAKRFAFNGMYEIYVKLFKKEQVKYMKT